MSSKTTSNTTTSRTYIKTEGPLDKFYAMNEKTLSDLLHQQAKNLNVFKLKVARDHLKNALEDEHKYMRFCSVCGISSAPNFIDVDQIQIDENNKVVFTYKPQPLEEKDDQKPETQQY